MTDLLTTQDLLADVADLTEDRLAAYLAADLIEPVPDVNGDAQFQPLDVPRLNLLCMLQDLYTLDADALGMVVSLIDQLHLVRSELNQVLDAIQAEAPGIRDRVIARVQEAQAEEQGLTSDMPPASPHPSGGEATVTAL